MNTNVSKTIGRIPVICCMLSALVFDAKAVIHYVNANSASPSPPYTSWMTAAATIQAAVNVASDGDLILVTNGIYQTGSTVANGVTNRVALTNAVTLQSVNGPSVTIIDGAGAMRCVLLASNAVISGFTLTNGYLNPFGAGSGVCSSILFSNAVALYGGIATNCTIVNNTNYAFGGGASQCVLDNCLLRGNVVGGSEAGGGASACVLNNCLVVSNQATGNGLGGGAAYCTLSNCVVMGNSAHSGGGLYLGPNHAVWNCVLAGNRASNDGGGASSSASIYTGSFLNNCVLIGNSAGSGGGAAYIQDLVNCLVVSNRAAIAGGVGGCGLLANCTVAQNTATNDIGGVDANGAANCIIYANTAPSHPNWSTADTFSFCCTTPLPSNYNVTNYNITSEPGFLDMANGNFRLASNSICINSGTAWNIGSSSLFTDYPFGPITQDLDGNPRVSGGAPDIGAYEFPNPASAISYAWLQQHAFATDGSVDHADPDHDGADNYSEWKAHTDPNDPTSYLRFLSISHDTNSLTQFTWTSPSPIAGNPDPGIFYFLQWSTNLTGPWTTFSTGIQPSGSTNFTYGAAYPDDLGVATNSSTVFFRIGVQ